MLPLRVFPIPEFPQFWNEGKPGEGIEVFEIADCTE